jgi:carboxynorspermidine decarboxylase
MGGENHVFSPAYRPEEIEEIASICDHVIFNSFAQLRRFGVRVKEIQAKRGVQQGIGLRINPECSTQDHAIYDPCAPFSRLGVTAERLEEERKADGSFFELISGLHCHTLCEQNSDALEETVRALEEKFGRYLALPRIRWLNLGGGHHITREDYDRERLIRIVRHLRETYDVEVYLEPGEAVALNAGYLVTEVLDRVENGLETLLLDASAACHMPDVLEMPYRPPLKESGEAGEKAYTYRLSSCTCLAGDIIGDYSFDREIMPGDRLYFEDMAIYSMVKNNTFNGMALPAIWKMDEAGDCTLVKQFGYEDFKGRLS